jgi:hypothetical protein
MRKMGDFKNNMLQVKRVPKIFKNLNSFEMMLKMLKKNANILKKNILDFCCFFRYFWIFQNFYQNMGQKLYSN